MYSNARSLGENDWCRAPYSKEDFLMTATGRKTGAKRLFTAIMAVLMLCTVMTTTAFAKNINDFTWLQSTGRKVIDLGQMSPGSNINTSGIKFYCVATSPSNGTYEVVLQRKGFMGIWQNVGNRYTCNQTSERKYDPRNGGYVNGQPSLLTWSTNQSGEYRIILENASAPQATGYTRVEAWAY